MIPTDLHRRRRPAPPRPRAADATTPLELITPLYRSAPQATTYAPLCRLQAELEDCHTLISTDGQRLCALVAYSEEAIEFTWCRPNRTGTLQQLILQVQRRLGRLRFVPVLETGRRRWSDRLRLHPRGRFFRARHSGPLPGRPLVPAGLRLRPFDPVLDLATAVELMNRAYPSLPNFMTVDRLAAMTRAPSYSADAWFFLEERGRREPVGLVMTGLSPEHGEGFIDWIQTAPRHGRRGLGRLLAQEALHRLRRADLITVSGSLEAPFVTGDLYRQCGFGEPCLWTILGSRRNLPHRPDPR